MEKPVIGADVGGVNEVIKEGINGYLVEPDNPHALADAIIMALQDKEKLNIIGIEGRKIAEQNYTVEKMCEKMYALYISLLGRIHETHSCSNVPPHQSPTEETWLQKSC